MKQDDGAVAVVVAILVVVLVGIAAFVTDFGMAYVNKTALQKSADAASLAAAGRAIDNLAVGETCAQFSARVAANTGGIRTTLETAADSVATANNGRSTRVGSIGVACSADSKRIEITYSNTGSTPTFLGGIFGESTVSASRTATSDIFVAPSLTGLRPYAVCAADEVALDARYNAGTDPRWAKISFPNDAGCGSYGGNWYSLSCPEDANKGTTVLRDNTLNGCETEVGIIPQFDASGAPLPTATINGSITAECTQTTDGTWGEPVECLEGNPGNLPSLDSEWDYLMTLDHIVLPTFSKPYNVQADATVTKCKSGGSSGCYPIRSFIAVKVCAYRFQNKTPSAVSTDPLCNGLTIANVRAGGNQDALWLALTGPVQTSGTSSPSDTPIGESSILQTRLIN